MFIPRMSFAKGWMPDADASHGPVDALLRGDNLTLDELGILGVRLGSAVVIGPLADTDVHSLATEVLNGVRYRLTGAGSSVYANGSSIQGNLAGSGDVQFSGHLGQILFARSTSKYKYDGTTVRNWGIPMTGGAPTVVAAAPDGKTFLVGNSAESPAIVLNEGTGGTFVTDHAGTANGAITITTDATSGRATITKTYAAATDFTVYDASVAGQASDIISLYLYVPEPKDFDSVDLLIDVNTGTFQEDYYAGTFTTEAKALRGKAADLLQGNYAAQGPDRERARKQQDDLGSGGRAVSQVRPDKPVSNAGWSKIFIRRDQLERSGSTAGKDWTTVKAVRVVVTTLTSMAVRLDTIRISSAKLFGPYKWAYQLMRDTGTYLALSPVSAYSAEYTISSHAAVVTIPADASRDTQATEVCVYRMGGVLDGFYRTYRGAITGAPGAAFAITETSTDADLLVQNLRLRTDLARPPDNIIDIEGPYFDRTFVLTSDGYLWPSLRLNPDGFATGQAIRVAAAEETAYWVKKAFGGLYIGTSKDIYRLEGDGAELPDGSVNFTKRPLNLDHPPVGTGIAQDGNLLVYVADDGWRICTGEASQSIVGSTSLLYRGYTRHGVAPISLGGRFRAAISRGQFLTTTPESDGTAGQSAVVYRHVPAREAWYRHVYPVAFRTVCREPDGTVLAGDTLGQVWQLDTGAGDGGVTVPVTLWTRQDDSGAPFARKEVTDLHLMADTGGATLTATLVPDAASGDPQAFTLSTTSLDLQIVDARAVGRVRLLQLKLTGSFTTFRFGGYGVTMVPRPMGVKAWDSGPIDLDQKDLLWVRHLYLKVNAQQSLTVRVLFDGTQRAQQTVTVTANTDQVLPLDIGRGCVGRQVRLVVTSAAEFLPYWIDVVFRSTGRGFQKPSRRVPIDVGAGVAT